MEDIKPGISDLLSAGDLRDVAGCYTVGFIRYEDYETFRAFMEANPSNPMRYTRNNRAILRGNNDRIYYRSISRDPTKTKSGKLTFLEHIECRPIGGGYLECAQLQMDATVVPPTVANFRMYRIRRSEQ